jgi:type II secretory pathway component GspD/PulD (secretin)
MKKLSILFTLLVAFMATALAQFPDDARFRAPTTLVTQADGQPLRVMVDALARTVGLTPIINLDEETGKKVVIYNIDQAKPFSQIWDILMSQEQLDYVLQANDVIVVGTPDAIAALKAQEAPVAVEVSEEQRQEFFRVNNEPKDVADIVERAVPGVAVEAFDSVKSIAVTGTPTQLAQVKAVLSQFDSPSTSIQYERVVYKLNNALAASGTIPDPADPEKDIQIVGLAEILAQTFEGVEVTVQQNGAAAGVEGDAAGAIANAPAQTESAKPTIIADGRTNSLIVTAPAEVQAQIAAVIEQLDVPQPQINLQVRIQEMTRTAGETLGIDWSAGLGNFAFKTLEDSVSFIFDAQQAISGLNIGATLDALERQGLSRRVDDANMTVINNGQVNLQSGGKIIVLIPGVDQNIERVINYGVQIKISPRLNNEGQIVISVLAQLDLLPPGGVSDPSLIDLSSRNVQTTVTVEPGQTVLLGALFTNTATTSTKGVPILSTIPIIGSAFNRTDTSKSDSELLLVLTADVVE